MAGRVMLMRRIARVVIAGLPHHVTQRSVAFSVPVNVAQNPNESERSNSFGICPRNPKIPKSQIPKSQIPWSADQNRIYIMLVIRFCRAIRHCMVGLCVCSAILSMCGCSQSEQMNFTKVELKGRLDRRLESIGYPLFLTSGETVTIDDPYTVHEMADFFPGLGSGRKAFSAVGSAPDMTFEFTKADGNRIVVYTKGYIYWGSDADRGDLDVRGDLKSYLAALFTNVKVQKSISTQPSE